MRASLQPVSESGGRRKGCHRFLRTPAGIRGKDGHLPPIPPEDIEFETNLQFLAKALIDAEDQMVAFVGAGVREIPGRRGQAASRMALPGLSLSSKGVPRDSVRLLEAGGRGGKSGPGQPPDPTLESDAGVVWSNLRDVPDADPLRSAVSGSQSELGAASREAKIKLIAEGAARARSEVNSVSDP